MNKLQLLSLLILTSSASFGQDLYDTRNITQIQLTFTDPSWDATLDSYYAAGLDQRLLATCVINGEQFDSVGVKYKGNSTYSSGNAKNPMNISLDYTLNQDYGGFETIKLSNGKNDPSFVREVLSYDIARKYMDAPLSNYAQVYINGSYHGLYSSSEAINGDYAERKLNADRDNTRFKCNPESVFSGNGSSLEYLGTDSSLYHDYYELKSDYGWNDLVGFTNYLLNNASTIETELDVDRALWMLAFNNILVNLDSYSGPFRQNYYLIRDDNGRMTTTTWDLNESIGGFEMINTGGGGPPGPGSTADLIELDPLLRLGDAAFPLISTLLADARYQKMYLAHCKTILEENFLDGSYETLANTFQDLVETAVSTDPNAFYTVTEFNNNMTSTVGSGPGSTIGITELMDDRADFLEMEAEFLTVPPSILSIVTSPSVVTANSSVAITANVSSPTYVYLGHRNYSSEIFTKTEMFDDGAHNDGAAGDGVYGATITVGASDIQYYIYAENANAGIFSPVRAEHEFHSLGITNDLVINEIMASNSTTQMDQDGEFDDWIELYNNSSNSISLSGYYLTDKPSNLSMWAFPNVSIAAGDYLIVWADKDTTQVGLHANFKLSAVGDDLLLVGAGLAIEDEVSFGAQTTDKSWARYPNGTGAFKELDPTYDSENIDPTASIFTEEPEQFLIYPNPATTQVLIEMDDVSAHEYRMYSINGMKVRAGTIHGFGVINVAGLTPGLYVITLDNGTASNLVVE